MSGVDRQAGGITIREAGEADAALLHALILALAEATRPGKGVTSMPADFGRHRDRFEALIAERDGEALGFCLSFPSFSSWRGEPGVYIQDLYVADEARGSGLGRRLVAETARRARERGARYLRLSVASHNAAAREFYERIGLTHAKEERLYQAVGPAFDRLADDTGARQ